MQQPISTLQNRINSIDILRGIVMVIMALDHVRDFFHLATSNADPLNAAATTPIWYFTRWITHFCAPTFIFLSGVSIYLQSLRKTKAELSRFLIVRGLWLIFVEVAIISFGWSFNPHYSFLFLQVIWAIGISMAIMGLLIRLPFKVILGLGLAIVLGHNLLDIPESAPGFHAGFIWNLLHHGRFTAYTYAPGHMLLIVYPFLAWTGLMMLGYCAGVYFSPSVSTEKRKKQLTFAGVGLVLLFLVLRFANFYGDPVPWTVQRNALSTTLSFLNVNKYPPSLLFMCITIGPCLLILPLLEKMTNGFTNVMRTYGRVAFFYYIVHIYLIHLVSAACFFLRGHTWQQGLETGKTFPFYFLSPSEGYHLPVVYLFWIGIVAVLYPLCRWYDNYKTNNPEKWWLSYL